MGLTKGSKLVWSLRLVKIVSFSQTNSKGQNGRTKVYGGLRLPGFETFLFDKICSKDRVSSDFPGSTQTLFIGLGTHGRVYLGDLGPSEPTRFLRVKFSPGKENVVSSRTGAVPSPTSRPGPLGDPPPVGYRPDVPVDAATDGAPVHDTQTFLSVLITQRFDV